MSITQITEGETALRHLMMAMTETLETVTAERDALKTHKPLTDEQAHKILLAMAEHMGAFGSAETTEQQLSAEAIRFIIERVSAHGIKEQP